MQPYYQSNPPNSAIPFVAASPAQPTSYGAQPIPIAIPAYYTSPPPQNPYYPQPTYIFQSPPPVQQIQPPQYVSYQMPQTGLSVPQNSSVLYNNSSNLIPTYTSNSTTQQNYLQTSPRLNSSISHAHPSKHNQSTDLSDPEYIRQQIKQIHIASPRANMSKNMLRKSLTSPSPSSISSSSSFVPYVPQEFISRQHTDERDLFERRNKRKMETQRINPPNFSDDEIYEDDRKKKTMKQPITSSRKIKNYSSDSEDDDVVEQTRLNRIRRKINSKAPVQSKQVIVESENEQSDDDAFSQNSVVNRVIATQTVEIPDSPIQESNSNRSPSPLLFNREEEQEDVEVLIDARNKPKSNTTVETTKPFKSSQMESKNVSKAQSSSDTSKQQSNISVEQSDKSKSKKGIIPSSETITNVNQTDGNKTASNSSSSLIQPAKKSEKETDKSTLSIQTNASKSSASTDRKTVDSIESGLGGFSDESTLSSLLNKPLKPTFLGKSKYLSQKQQQPVPQIVVESDDENEDLSKKTVVPDSSDESDQTDDLNEQQKQADEEQAIELYKWWVKFIYRQNTSVDFFVYGLKDDKVEWNSSNIVSRISEREVASERTKYCLIGVCDEKKFNSNNSVHFSRSFLKKFYNGFPSDYKTVIIEEAARIKKQLEEQKSNSTVSLESNAKILSQIPNNNSKSSNVAEQEKSKKQDQPSAQQSSSKQSSSKQAQEEAKPSKKKSTQETEVDEPVVRRKRGRPKKSEQESKSKKVKHTPVEKENSVTEEKQPEATTIETEAEKEQPVTVQQGSSTQADDTVIEFSNDLGGFEDAAPVEEQHNFSQDVFPELSNPDEQNQFTPNIEIVEESDDESFLSITKSYQSSITPDTKEAKKKKESKKKNSPATNVTPESKKKTKDLKKQKAKADKDDEQQKKSKKSKIKTSPTVDKISKKRKSASSKASPVKRRRKSARVQEIILTPAKPVVCATTKSGRASVKPGAYWAASSTDYITQSMSLLAQKQYYTVVVKSEKKKTPSATFRTIKPIQAEEQDFLSQGDEQKPKVQRTIDKSLTRTLDTVLHTDELDPLIDIL